MSSEKCVWGNNTYHPKWTVVHIPRPQGHIATFYPMWTVRVFHNDDTLNRETPWYGAGAESSCWASKAPVEHCCLTAAISTGMANLALSGHIVGCSHWTSPVDVPYKTYINHSPSFRSTNSTPGNLNYLTRPSAKQQVFIHSSRKRDVYLPFAAFSAFLRWSCICLPFAVFLSSSFYFLPIYLLPPRLLQLRLRVWLQLQRRRRLLLQLYYDDDDDDDDDDDYYQYHYHYHYYYYSSYC